MKIRKLSAAREVGNHVCTACATVTASSVSPVTFARTPMVETIASFAVKPDREAATGCHSPKPRGANRGAMKPPITASKLFPLSSTRPKPPFSKPNPPRNHITTQARNRIVPAFQSFPYMKQYGLSLRNMVLRKLHNERSRLSGERFGFL